jgi:hypothetical protein
VSSVETGQLEDRFVRRTHSILTEHRSLVCAVVHTSRGHVHDECGCDVALEGRCSDDNSGAPVFIARAGRDLIVGLETHLFESRPDARGAPSADHVVIHVEDFDA